MGKLNYTSQQLEELKAHEITAYHHSLRVAYMMARFGLHLELDSKAVSELYELGLVHDIGKLYIDRKVLTGKKALTNSDYSQIRNHTIYGHALLKNRGYSSEVLRATLFHHENVNGTGYFKKKKSEIPYYARILRVVDSYDAMSHDRSYQKSRSLEESIDELKRLKGSWYQPVLVDNFCQMLLKKNVLVY